MAPKSKDTAKAKAKAKRTKATTTSAEPLKLPSVTSTEVDAAKKALECADAKRRASSNMLYWLEQRGEKELYGNMEPKQRKDYAIMWYAWSVKEGETKKSTKRNFGTLKKEKKRSKWFCKKEIIDKLGETKGNAKIQKLDEQPNRHRPDMDTNEDGEWHREYKLYSDEEEEGNYEGVDHALSSTKDLKGDDEKKEAAEDMASFRLLNKGGDSLTKPATAEDKKDSPNTKVKIEGSIDGEDLKTFNKLKTNPKMILRSLQELVVEQKRMFELAQAPNKIKYTTALTDEITKLLPKLKSDYNSVEKIHLKAGTESCIPDPEILAIARKIDKNYTGVDNIVYWFGRLCPKSEKADKDKDKDKGGKD